MKERLIINGVDFDFIMDGEKIILHTRIEEMWKEQKDRDYAEWRNEMFEKTGMPIHDAENI